MQLKHKMRFMQHMGKVLWLTELLKGADGVSGWRCVSGSASGGRPVELTMIKSRDSLRTNSFILGLPRWFSGTNPPASAGTQQTWFNPRSGRSPEEGHGNPLQCSCLENPMDRGARRATVHEVEKSQTQHSTDKILYHLRDSRYTQNIQVRCWKSFASAWSC